MHHPDYYERKVAKSMYEQKAFEVGLDLKMLQESGEFSGYASVFDTVDNHRDVVLRGAFRRTLADRSEPVKLLWQHKMEEPIGIITELHEDQYGLYMKGKLLLDVERAREAYSLIKNGAIRGLSIGYRPVRYHYDPESGVRELLQVDLVEISLVSQPANDAAEINEVKMQAGTKTRRTSKTREKDLAALAAALQHAINVAEGSV